MSLFKTSPDLHFITSGEGGGGLPLPVVVVVGGDDVGVVFVVQVPPLLLPPCPLEPPFSPLAPLLPPVVVVVVAADVSDLDDNADIGLLLLSLLLCANTLDPAADDDKVATVNIKKDSMIIVNMFFEIDSICYSLLASFLLASSLQRHS